MRIVNGSLSFDPWDWSKVSGKAREVIDLLKRSGSKYVNDDKTWALTPKAESMLSDQYGSYIDVSEPMGTEDDLEPVFGTKANGTVTSRGLVGLYGDLETHRKLIESLERMTGVKAGILDMVVKDYEGKLEIFNELILEKGYANTLQRN